MPNDPVNTVAQLWLWRLEGRVAGAVIGCALIAVWAVVHIAFGRDAGQLVMDVIGTAVIIAPVACVAYAIYFMLSPAAQLRRTDKALARYRAALNGD